MNEKTIENKRKALGKVLIKERETRKLSISDASELIGVSRQNLTNLERGNHFNFITVVKVCSYYDLEVAIIQKAVR